MTNLEWWRAHRPKELDVFLDPLDCFDCPCMGTAFCEDEGVQGCIDALVTWARAEHAEVDG